MKRDRLGMSRTSRISYLMTGKLQKEVRMKKDRKVAVAVLVAVFLSAVFLKEPLTWQTGIGALLVLGCMLISELQPKKKE